MIIIRAFLEWVASYFLILLSLATGKPIASDYSDLPKHLREAYDE